MLKVLFSLLVLYSFSNDFIDFLFILVFSKHNGEVTPYFFKHVSFALLGLTYVSDPYFSNFVFLFLTFFPIYLYNFHDIETI